MQGKHTPGPWRTADWQHAQQTAILSENGSCIARAFSPLGGTYKDAQANARLIAAAPLMLEALREARACLVALIFDLQRGDGLTPEQAAQVLEVIDRVGPLIDSAIAAAATGEDA